MPTTKDATSVDSDPPTRPARDLQNFEGILQLLVENVTEYAIYMLNPQGRVITWNSGAQRLKGYAKSEVLGQNFSMFFLPEAIEAGEPERELEIAARDGRYEVETWRRRKGGQKFWALVSLTAVRNAKGELVGFAKVTRDLTQQREFEHAQEALTLELDRRVEERTRQLEGAVEEVRAKNKEVESLAAAVSHQLREKDVLLREVYHRVKNNLQVVQSLLKMGARMQLSRDARAAIDTAVQRVHVMALVHEHLYRKPDLSGITLSEYLLDVAQGAIASNSQDPNQIQLEFDVDPVPVQMDHAIPLGLLVHELVSNSIKHGLPAGAQGQISISAQAFPGALRLTVRDNGAGLPEGFDPFKSPSLGLKLALNLSGQLGGELHFTSDNGCLAQADLTRLQPLRSDAGPDAQIVSSEAESMRARASGIPAFRRGPAQ